MNEAVLPRGPFKEEPEGPTPKQELAEAVTYLAKGDETMETRELFGIGEAVIGTILPDLRAVLVQHITNLAAAEDILSVIQAKAEAAIVEAAGGEKGLSSNTEARKRALVIGLSDDGPYQLALETVRQFQRQKREAEMLVKNRQDQCSLIKAALYAASDIAIVGKPE